MSCVIIRVGRAILLALAPVHAFALDGERSIKPTIPLLDMGNEVDSSTNGHPFASLTPIFFHGGFHGGGGFRGGRFSRGWFHNNVVVNRNVNVRGYRGDYGWGGAAAGAAVGLGVGAAVGAAAASSTYPAPYPYGYPY